ncbi:ferritin-like domain-containing protein [Pigmentiphaga soli]|uniref:ferritin-like domain-containing protein n=1 Tax=Pigmentiphaga soli TaxID=1007095 RepID=UPI003CD08ADA
MVLGKADSPSLPWSLDNIDLAGIDMQRVRDDENLFYVLTAASFIETGSDLYTRNLVSYYHDDPEVSAWLGQHWEPEELQHGRALRAYIERVWPDFDWPAAFASFFDEYSRSCTVEEFEPSYALEMAARCVVETGTATLYTSINAYTDEPVLKRLTAHIRADEVRHYKNFYHYFCKYNQAEGNGRSAVFGALARRVAEIRNDDSDCAMRHVFAARHPELAHDAAALRKVNRRTRSLVVRNLPADMAVKMLLKPLHLSPWANKSIQYPLVRLAQLLK